MKAVCSRCKLVDTIAYEYWDAQSNKMVRFCVDCTEEKVREMEKERKDG